MKHSETTINCFELGGIKEYLGFENEKRISPIEYIYWEKHQNEFFNSLNIFPNNWKEISDMNLQKIVDANLLISLYYPILKQKKILLSRCNETRPVEIFFLKPRIKYSRYGEWFIEKAHAIYFSEHFIEKRYICCEYFWMIIKRLIKETSDENLF